MWYWTIRFGKASDHKGHFCNTCDDVGGNILLFITWLHYDETLNIFQLTILFSKFRTFEVFRQSGLFHNPLVSHFQMDYFSLFVLKLSLKCHYVLLIVSLSVSWWGKAFKLVDQWPKDTMCGVFLLSIYLIRLTIQDKM